MVLLMIAMLFYKKKCDMKGIPVWLSYICPREEFMSNIFYVMYITIYSFYVLCLTQPIFKEDDRANSS
jgi:hypothetical protein